KRFFHAGPRESWSGEKREVIEVLGFSYRVERACGPGNGSVGLVRLIHPSADKASAPRGGNLGLLERPPERPVDRDEKPMITGENRVSFVLSCDGCAC